MTAIATSFSQTPLHIGLGLFVIGIFAAIYHPVGLAIVTMKWKNTGMRIATNGVWGNLGVASAALITGYLIDNGGWRLAFILPGLFSIAMGIVYLALRWHSIRTAEKEAKSIASTAAAPSATYRALLLRVAIIVFLTTAVSSLIFQATTFALPKIFLERLEGLAMELAAWFSYTALSGQGEVASVIGFLAFIVFAIASIAQLVVGSMLDKFGPRRVFMTVAIIQIIFFATMPGLTDAVSYTHLTLPTILLV